ncbi:MAG: endo-1,3-alpha-glucanase family glycosylhydrolase [Thermoguttaceae bacterium]
MTNHLQATVVLLLLPAGLAAVATATEPGPSKRHFVFAHYMVCFAAQGERVEDYKREIREAQAAGIDGFALNCGAWHDEPHYPRRTKSIYQAAEELGTGFNLFFSVDFAGLGRHPPGEFESYVLDMVKTYGHHRSQFRVDGRTVVSTFAGEQGVEWKKDILAPLKAAGYDVFLVPFFYPRPRVTELPDEATVRQHYRRWADVVDGMFYFGGAGTAPQIAASNAAYAKVLGEAGKTCMCSFSPMYWGAAQPDRRYYETCGGEGVELQWKSIIEYQPDWVEIVTWNDFSESYVCPVASSGQSVPSYLTSRSSHAGYLELSRYYIEWYKTGRQPPLKDALFWFYRVHPKDTVAVGDRRVTARHGPVADDLYVTTMLTARAELRVTSGGRKSVHPLSTGIQHLRIPFSCGAQHFAVYRDERSVLSGDGEPIVDRIKSYDFFPASGFAYAP